MPLSMFFRQLSHVLKSICLLVFPLKKTHHIVMFINDPRCLGVVLNALYTTADLFMHIPG